MKLPALEKAALNPPTEMPVCRTPRASAAAFANAALESAVALEPAEKVPALLKARLETPMISPFWSTAAPSSAVALLSPAAELLAAAEMAIVPPAALVSVAVPTRPMKLSGPPASTTWRIVPFEIVTALAVPSSPVEVAWEAKVAVIVPALVMVELAVPSSAPLA